MTFTQKDSTQESEKYDVSKEVLNKKLHYKITIDFLNSTQVNEIKQLINDYIYMKNFHERLFPSYIKIESHQGETLSKCGREGCQNLILGYDSFCSKYCLDNYVSLDEDEMR